MPPGSAPGAPPPPLSRLELKLRTEWKVNRVFIAAFASRVKFRAGLVNPTRKWDRGLPSGPGILDRSLVRDADSAAMEHFLRHDNIYTDRLTLSKFEDFPDLPRIDYDRSNAGLREEAAKQIAAHRERVAQMESRLASHAAELDRLTNTDDRTELEKKGGEPPHPPYKRMDEIRSEMTRLREDLDLEKQLLQAAERDAEKLEERLEKQAEKTEEFIKEKVKEGAKRL